MTRVRWVAAALGLAASACGSNGDLAAGEEGIPEELCSEVGPDGAPMLVPCDPEGDPEGDLDDGLDDGPGDGLDGAGGDAEGHLDFLDEPRPRSGGDLSFLDKPRPTSGDPLAEEAGEQVPTSPPSPPPPAPKPETSTCDAGVCPICGGCADHGNPEVSEVPDIPCATADDPRCADEPEPWCPYAECAPGGQGCEPRDWDDDKDKKDKDKKDKDKKDKDKKDKDKKDKDKKDKGKDKDKKDKDKKDKDKKDKDKDKDDDD